MKKLVLIVGAVAIAAGAAYLVVKTVEELEFVGRSNGEEGKGDLTPFDVESQLLQHE